VLLFLGLAVAPPGARAATAIAPALAGHWRCTAAGTPPVERSYFFEVPRADMPSTARELFGSADTALPDGTPVTSFEHWTERGDGSVTVATVEGNGTAPAATPGRFTGRSVDGAAPFTLVYEVNGDAMRRTATRGTAVVDDERCAREPEPPVSSTCAQPDAPAGVVHAVEPDYPEAAAPTRAKGVVNVRVVVDERSRVLWADVITSDNPVFNEAAVRAARDSTYRTATVKCRPIGAVYVFTVQFEY